MKRTTFASLAYDSKKKKTRREKFLEEMDQVIPWKELIKIISPHYPKIGNGRHPMPATRMLRIHPERFTVNGYILYNNGTGFPIRRWKTRFMTLNR